MRSRSLFVPSLLVIATAFAACRSNSGGERKSTPSAEPDRTGERMEGGNAPAAQAEQAQQTLGQEGERATRLKQQSEFLSQQYIDQGDALLDKADLEGALGQYSQALEVDQNNQAARERIRRVQALMGEEFAGAAQGIQDAIERETVRRAQARLEAEQLTTDADNALRAQEYDKAIENYRRALNILRFNPLIADQTLDERVLEGKLQSAVQLAEERSAADQQAKEQVAQADRVAKEEEQRTYRETKLRQLYAEANAAFQREQYGQAQTLAEQILLYDPGNEAATKMRDIARDARHLAVNEGDRRSFRENWVRTFEELGSLGVPQTDTVQFDLKRWREVQERKPYEFSGADPVDAADKEAVLRILEERRVPARFGADGEGAPLEEVASYLQNVTGVNFVLSAKVRDELDEAEKSIQLDLPERSVKQLLDIITEVRENLRYKIEDGVVKFVTKEELVGGQVLRMYEVRNLIRPVRDFPGREINIQPSGGVPASDGGIL